jgi:hypothetical protein
MDVVKYFPRMFETDRVLVLSKLGLRRMPAHVL